MLESENIDFEDFEIELDRLMGEVRDAVIQAVATKRSNDVALRLAGHTGLNKALEHLHWFVEAARSKTSNQER